MSVADLTVLTCTIPGREIELAKNIDSVRDQEKPVEAHIIISDNGDLGPERKYNRAFKAVTTTWFSILDDDNWWFHHHVQTIAPRFNDADVIYTWDAGLTRPRMDISHMSQDEKVEFFLHCNAIDQSCAIRSELFDRVGGYHLNVEDRAMDQDLWMRIAAEGGRFLAIPIETWFYTAR